MQLSFEDNLRAFERDLSDLARGQLPFATARALNATTEAIAANTTRALDERLDRPTPFTKRGIARRFATKARPWSDVFFRDIQAAYLAWAEDGGERLPKGMAIPIPVGLRRNAYGNMARGALARLRGRSDVFTPGPGSPLPPGIYQRRKSGLRMLAAFEPRAAYRPRLSFLADAERTARAYFPIAFERALRRALATARR